MVQRDGRGSQLAAKGFQDTKEVPSDSLTDDEVGLLNETMNCLSL
jgi:hypothetical protein